MKEFALGHVNNKQENQLSRTKRIRCVRTVWSVALLAVLYVSQVSLGQEEGAPPPASESASPPPLIGVPVNPEPMPFVSVPQELKDAAYEKYVDYKLLTEAYLSLDASAMTDVALQLREGERILLRPHQTLRVAPIIDLALKVATDKGDVATLERIEKLAETTADNDLAGRVKLARQLQGQPRDAAPMIPPPDENLSEEDAAAAHSILSRLERSRIVGDVEDLKALKDEVEALNTKEGSLFEFVQTQVAEAVAATAVEEEESGDTASILRKLATTSRGGTCAGPYLEGTVAPNGKTVTVREGARTFYVDDENDMIYFPDMPNWGWVPQNSAYGLKGRFGVTYTHQGWFRLIAANEKYFRVYYPDGQPPKVENQDWVEVASRNSEGGFDYSWTGLKTVAPLTFKGLPQPVSAKANQMVAAGGGNITVSLPPNMVAAGGGNIIAAGGGNIIAAGGGNVIDGAKIKLDQLTSMVAAGGGNITVKNADSVDLIGKGGAGLSTRRLMSLMPAPPKAATAWANAPRN